MRWLAFRLQFESGHCKLASGDPRGATATRARPLRDPAAADEARLARTSAAAPAKRF